MARLTVALVTTLLALGAGAAIAPAAQATYLPLGNGDGWSIRPTSFGFGTGASISKVHWSRWGQRKAVGRGRLFVYNNSTGSTHSSQTTITVDKASGAIFHRVRWRYSNGRRGSSVYTNAYDTDHWVLQ